MKIIRLVLVIGILWIEKLTALAQPTNAWPPYDALYCFGFSWTDTQGKFMDGSCDFVCNNPQYWQNHSCNGLMWSEFLSTKLGLSYLPANNLARGAATTGDTLTQVNWLGAMANPGRNLYVVWVAAGDFLNAVGTTDDHSWNNLVTNLLGATSNIVQRLYAKGARSVVIQNCLDLSLAPNVLRQFGSNTNQLIKIKAKTELFNSLLETNCSYIQHSKPDLRLAVVDVFAHENEVYKNSGSIGFTKVFPDALSDAALHDKSFTGLGADYLFWDGLHGTSKLQDLVSEWTIQALTTAVPEDMEVQLAAGTISLHLNHLLLGRVYTVQTSVDLANWTNVVSFAADTGTNQWTDTTPVGRQVFYRLGWQP